MNKRQVTQRMIDKGRAMTREDYAIYCARRSEHLNAMYVFDWIDGNRAMKRLTN